MTRNGALVTVTIVSRYEDTEKRLVTEVASRCAEMRVAMICRNIVRIQAIARFGSTFWCGSDFIDLPVWS